MATLHTMPGGVPAPAKAGVAAAIERVLGAERAAAADVAECRARCAARIAAARLQARQALDRAERLAQAIHARTERVAESRVSASIATDPQASSSDAEVAAHVAAAVARIARELTGAGDE